MALADKAGQEGPCQGHDGPCENAGTWRRQNSSYIDDDSNWVCMCDECFAAREAEWDERWREYWADVLPFALPTRRSSSSDDPRTFPRRQGD